MERTALAILQDPRDAEEAVQEAFIRVIENFSKIYEIPCKNLGAWLVTIVRNEAITMLRRRRDHLPLDEDWAGFERQARDAPDYASLVALFARLPETYRAALEMKLLLGYSGAEIARRLGLTESAVNTRISRGRALLRKIFEEEGIEP
ncbi:MAG TPA: RNA polymerase [Oscillibacter sp.]|nr:MAG: RNA polymerase [Oscillibacter sp.]HBL63793.1 RNA polymerase [Oscillibacter sp.]HCV06535.1 RNA polymerase [Oscillibacter sp.]